ncbi:hypothetical protein EVB68_006 [Rhizobium phage RHph_Y2_6]|uniref:Uncharacterized protein n=2 Tax=Acanvirus TaxID=3044653 RepID=A0AAE7VM87_9CAUD|nr:hypothetical protein PP748_gp006 [Rhizobium phage RHph_Y2_6]YP_010658315.1 hypothetical protein PP750_gp05 [Rhizobium phage RHEph16]QIG68743.1 hypothetical protein EVB68_006 [Rhizobium phage RHph_Y2_6]QXV74314.1 hypothetical protein [Rhizobium phage RHEph16]
MRRPKDGRYCLRYSVWRDNRGVIIHVGWADIWGIYISYELKLETIGL